MTPLSPVVLMVGKMLGEWARHGALDQPGYRGMRVGAAPFGVIFGTLAIGSGLPVWLTLGMSALVFGERFTPLRYAGMGLILAGLAVIVLRLPGRITPSPAPRME